MWSVFLPADYQPVSPIVWVRIKEDIELLLPMEIKLPHVVIDAEQVKLAFAKADDREYAYDTIKGKLYSFEYLKNAKTDFTSSTGKDCGYATLYVDHCCLYCSIAQVSPELAMSKGYCFHTFSKSLSPSSHKIIHVCTYFLRECINVSDLVFECGVGSSLSLHIY